MKKLLYIIYVVFATMSLSACHEHQDFDNDVYGNFDALWECVDEHYCFFEYKNIDWNEVGARYRAKLRPKMNDMELFEVCADMLKELQDGHTNLISPWDVSRYWIWEQYPVNYNERLIDEHYLHFNYKKSSSIKYGLLENNFGYMYYGDFMGAIGEGNLDIVLAQLASTDGLIIDVRNNGGGYLPYVEMFVRRFITERIHAGAIAHKTGPGHDEFSSPYDYYFEPIDGTRIKYLKPVVVLANRGSYSATNNFVSIMKSLPNVRIVGDVTGGGSGMPFSYDLPNGWSVRLSSSEITDPFGNVTEFGVEPSPGCKVDMTDDEIAAGTDAIMERAFIALKDMIGK